MRSVGRTWFGVMVLTSMLERAIALIQFRRANKLVYIGNDAFVLVEKTPHSAADQGEASTMIAPGIENSAASCEVHAFNNTRYRKRSVRPLPV